MQATTGFHNGIANPIFPQTDFVFHDPVAFHPTNGVFNTHSGGGDSTIGLLLQHESRAKSATKAPKQQDLTRWDLSDLINVSVELGLASQAIEKLSHSVREYRNLVHPGNEIRNKLTFDAEEAKIALEVLHIVHRELS